MFDTSAEISRFYAKMVALPTTEQTEMRERRNTNRQRLKLGLEADKRPKPFGMHSQGSYAMRTMVQDEGNDYDIDDGVYFYKEDLVGPQGGELSALSVRQMVCEAMQDNRFSAAPQVKKNCVRVFYNEGFHVDVPSYRRREIKDEWTGKVTETFELASSDWKHSDPLEVTKWFRRQNSSLSPDAKGFTDGQYLRVVKLLKLFARSRSSWKGQIATGFMITKLVSDHFYSQAGRDDISLRSVMQEIERRFQSDITHPTLPNETIGNKDDARLKFLKAKLKENLDHLQVLDDPKCAHKDAMGAWDKVFCTEWFSDQPEPEGGETASVGSDRGPSAPVQKRGGGRYGTVE